MRAAWVGLGLLLAAPARAVGADLELPPEAPPSLRAAWEEVQRYPGDYSALATLAYAATEVAPELAVGAWEEAERVCGGNFETAAGQVAPRLATGDVTGARAAARRALAHMPHSVPAHLLLAESLREPAGTGAPECAALAAARVTRTAVALAPADAAVRCALGWSRLNLWDRAGARRAFEEALVRGGDCGDQARSASLSRTPVWGGAWAALVTEPSPLGTDTGGWLVASGGATVKERWLLSVTGRASVSGRLEAWGRAGVVAGRHGAWVMGGGAWEPVGGSSGGPGPGSGGSGGGLALDGSVLASRIWLSHGVTLRLEGAYSAYSDGRGWQGGLGLTVPVLAPLVVDAAFQVTAFDTDVTTLATDLGAGRLRPSGQLALRIRTTPVAVVVGGRLGPEVRPIRMDQAYVWSLDRQLVGGGLARLEIPVGRAATLHLGGEIQRLQATTGVPAGTLGLLEIGIAATTWESRP